LGRGAHGWRSGTNGWRARSVGALRAHVPWRGLPRARWLPRVANRLPHATPPPRSCISQHWRGKPLVSYAVILNLIAATTTTTGLTVERYLDTNPYPAGQQVSDAQMSTLRLERATFHGEWNYTIAPRDALTETVIL